MKTTLITLLIFTQTTYSFCQKSATQELKGAISDEFNKWLKKSDFETNAEYESRIKNESDASLKKISETVFLAQKEWYLSNTCCNLGKYDAENETFPLYLGHKYCSSRRNRSRDTLYVTISKDIASSFYNFFSVPKSGENTPPVYLVPIDAAIINDQWKITKGIVLFDAFWMSQSGLIGLDGFELIKEKGNYSYTIDRYGTKNKYHLIDIKTTKSLAKEVYCYEWNINQQPGYSPSDKNSISFSLQDLNIILPSQTVNTQSTNTIKPKVPDLEISSIQTKNKNPNAFAVVIGNKDYQSTKHVSFALNDAKTMKEYLINVLGYSEGNIFYLENATKSSFETYFGTKENPQGKLYNNIKQGISDVFIYYAGHGAPGLKDNKGYFVPIDCDPQYVEQGGYSLDVFYQNIAKLEAKSITVITDACFSGAEIFNNISPIIISVSNPVAVTENCVVMSSSTGSQVSSWYNDKQHGMFTYFFLKAIQDKEKSDSNKDKKLTYQEIFEYVSDKTEGVPYYARSIHGVDQLPTIQGEGIDNIFIEYK